MSIARKTFGVRIRILLTEFLGIYYRHIIFRLISQIIFWIIFIPTRRDVQGLARKREREFEFTAKRGLGVSIGLSAQRRGAIIYSDRQKVPRRSLFIRWVQKKQFKTSVLLIQKRFLQNSVLIFNMWVYWLVPNPRLNFFVLILIIPGFRMKIGMKKKEMFRTKSLGSGF